MKLWVRKTFIYLALIVYLCEACSNHASYIFNEGAAQGTSYHITYESPDSIDYHDSITRILKEFDMSLSVYEPNSLISRINKNDTNVLANEYFTTIFDKAEEAFKLSNGLFDITIAPLVNAWGFGPNKKLLMNQMVIDSLLQFVGMEKVKLQNGKIIKSNPGVKLDVNAIAQGYSCDIIASFLKKMGCRNYLVEIGGEVHAHGKNPDGKSWRVGIDTPSEGNLTPGQYLQTVVNLKNRSMATSGNYRKFFEENGVKYAHTINPKTGYPVKSNLLSATIVADDCITADAYATICMVSGLNKSIEIIEKSKSIDAYLIYSNDKGEFKVYSTKRMNRMTDPGPEAFPQ
jgi:thiamine biosynthesis lipoprotein